MRENTVRQRTAEYERGKEWFDTADFSQKHELSEHLVFGTFDGRDWGFDRKPSADFMRGVAYAWDLWQKGGE